KGQKVVVYPLIPCKSCYSCKNGMFHLCDNYNYIGSRCDGGFAEFVKCPEENIVLIPDEVSLEDAALTEPCSVSLHGVLKAGIKSGDTVVVYGLGTIGIFVAQWARLFGAENIIGIDTDAYKFGIAKNLGVDACTSTDDIKEARKGADAVFECAGTVSTQEKCILTAKKCGKIVLLGNSEGDLTIRKENVPLILRKELSIMGSWNSTIKDDWKKSISCMQSGMIKCSEMVTHRKKLSEIKNVFLEMHQKSYPYLKINFVI
ncbi:MAG: zinc-binding dehydrogenase, partial [Candidatus Aenigmarchaeota archaeon]|nr:zinc-binding dehydrogenase [Candidatus Aenigmarchaeota archaeon]MDI6722683.1 zinc-binding dehydrogenase [Candidatus Aenigmarchaeota archaeon]